MVRALGVPAFLIAAVACGGEVGDTVSPATAPASPPTLDGPTSFPTESIEPIEPGTWSETEFGPAGGDLGVAVASSDQTTVIITGGQGNVATAWTGTGGEFEPVTMPATFDEYASVAEVVPFGDGFVAVGGGSPSFLPVVWRSSNGRSWELVATQGLEEPADIASVIVTPTGLMAAGARRVGDDASLGPFAPAVWTSPDGTEWTEVTSPFGGDGYSYLADLVATDAAVVALANVNGVAQVWRSSDGGLTWSASRIDVDDGLGAVAVSSLAMRDSTLLGFGTAGDDHQGEPVVVRSDDLGATFVVAPLRTTIAPGLDGITARTRAADGAWWVTTFRYTDAFTQPEVCYRDPGDCEDGNGRSVLLHSADGETWSEVDTVPLFGDGYGRLHDVVDTPGGALVVGSAEQLTSWRWSGGSTAPPAADAYVEPAPPDLATATYGDTIEVGVTYRYPLFIHCGMDHLGEFNDQQWYVEAAGETPETGAGKMPDPSWPVAQQTIFGYVTLVDATTIEYTILDGEVIATYSPSDVEPPDCE